MLTQITIVVTVAEPMAAVLRKSQVADAGWLGETSGPKPIRPRSVTYVLGIHPNGPSRSTGHLDLPTGFLNHLWGQWLTQVKDARPYSDEALKAPGIPHFCLVLQQKPAVEIANHRTATAQSHD